MTKDGLSAAFKDCEECAGEEYYDFLKSNRHLLAEAFRLNMQVWEVENLHEDIIDAN